MGRRRGSRVEASELRAGGETEGSLRETREMGRGTSLGIDLVLHLFKSIYQFIYFALPLRGYL